MVGYPGKSVFLSLVVNHCSIRSRKPVCGEKTVTSPGAVLSSAVIARELAWVKADCPR